MAKCETCKENTTDYLLKKDTWMDGRICKAGKKLKYTERISLDDCYMYTEYEYHNIRFYKEDVENNPDWFEPIK